MFADGREQLVPQAPQLVALLRVSISHPLAGLPSQSAKPGLQVVPQSPERHTAVELAAVGQFWPHAPQCVGEFNSVSQPLAALPSQLPRPTEHWSVHAPMMHAAVAPGPDAQARLQAPQWAALEESSVSQPSERSPSQSPKPGSHVPDAHAPAVQTGVPLG